MLFGGGGHPGVNNGALRCAPLQAHRREMVVVAEGLTRFAALNQQAGFRADTTGNPQFVFRTQFQLAF